MNTTISVANLETVGSGGGVRKTEDIHRKIFILSATKLNIKSSMASAEGKPLAYFENRDDVSAQLRSGVNEAYWLRSAYLWDDIQAWVIDAKGETGGASVSYKFSLRPAFCLDGNTEIVEVDWAAKEAKAYVLDLP